MYKDPMSTSQQKMIRGASSLPKKSALAAQASKRGNKKQQNKGNNRSLNGAGPVLGVANAYSNRQTSVGPRIISRTSKGFRVVHRELVDGGVIGTTAFTVTKRYACNPGLSATFPWLAPQAAQWEMYRFHRLEFEFVPRVPTDTQGSMFLSPDYDVSDPTPTTEIQLSDNWGTVEDVVWKELCIELDPSAMNALGPRKYIRQGNVAGDLKTFDSAVLFVGSNDFSAQITTGKLWVSYDVEFFVPQNSPSTSSTPTQTSLYVSSTTQGITTATPVNATGLIAVYDPLNFGVSNAGVFTPPAGTYEIDFSTQLFDMTAETFTGLVTAFKNGAALTPNVYQEFVVNNPANGIHPLNLNVVIPFNGTDTFSLNIEAVGAAGALSIQNGQMVVKAA
jgi:hypothetical protein